MTERGRRFLAQAKRRPVAVLTGLAVFAGAGAVPILASVLQPERATIAATVRASVTDREGQASGSAPDISADGRFVVFVSASSAFGNGSTNQIYRRDLVDGTTRLVSVAASGVGAGNAYSDSPVVSGDGRFIAFSSGATNLVALDQNGSQDIFVRDMATGTTQLASVSSSGVQASEASRTPSISADGNRVSFRTASPNLVAGDDVQRYTFRDDIFVRDVPSATTRKVSVKPLALEAGSTQCGENGCNADYDDFMEVAVGRHALSADGHYVTFRGGWGVGALASEPCTGTYIRRTVFAADVDAGGDAVALAPVDQGCNGVPAVSGDGSTISFRNRANTGWRTVSPSGGALSETIPLPVANQGVSEAVLSADGAKLAFHSAATNLVGEDTNARVDVFAVPRGGGSAARLSVDSDGKEARSFPNSSGSDSPSISDSGEQIAFQSVAADLVGGDTNNTTDVFVRSEVPEYLTLAQVRGLSGFLANSAYASDPVNTATGNFTDTWVDMSFPGVFGLDVARTYNSREPDTGALGRGWSTTFATRVSELSGGDVQVVQDSGRAVVFRADGPGRWLAPEQLWATLIADGDGSYSLRHDDGPVEDFGADGRLASLTNWDGQSVTLTRNSAGTVATATSSTGASATFSYDGTSGRLTEVTAGDGRRVSYAYGAGDTPALASVTLPDGRTQSYAADAGGRVTEVRDGAGTLLVASAYDPLGRVLSQTTPDGATVSFAYDQKTRATTVRDSASGDVTRYLHDPEGRIARVVDATGESLVRGYDAGGAGNLTSVTDRSGTAVGQEFTPERLLSSRTLAGVNADGSDRRREYAYDAARRVVSVTEKAPGGTDVVTTLTYTGTNRVPATVAGPAPVGHPAPPLTAIESEAGLLTRITDPDGVVTAYTWDPATRRRSSQTVAPGTPEASTTTFTYTVEGWLASTTTSLGHVSSNTYDSAGRLTVRRNPDGAEWRTTYDDAGRPVAETDPLGHALTYRYDVASGRLVEQVDRRGKSTRSRYNGAGDLTEVIAPDDDADAANDPTTRYTYGPLARLESVTDPSGVVTRYSYDGDGRVTALSDGAGHAWRTTYWRDGQVRSQSHPEAGAGQETKSFYDPLGRLARVVDPTGAETSYSYDAGGRPVRTEGPRPGQVEARTYTPAGRLQVVTDAVGAVTRYAYDPAGRVASVTAAHGTPQAAATRTTYDGEGRMVASTSAAGLTTTFAYDPAGRVVTETAPGGRVTRRAWTPRGELASETDAGGGVVSYSYDPAGSLTGVTDALGNPTAYGYDARGNRTSRSDALGGVETWAYDAADRPTSHRGPLGHVLATRAYDPLGRLATTTDASGRTETRTYDRAGRLVRQSWANGAETLVRTRAWDPAGRLIGVTGPEGTTAYGHDEASNVVSVDAPGTERDLSYAWDLAGRRSAVTHPDGAVVRSAYDPLGRLATVAHPTLGTTTYEWDLDGRLRSEDLPGDGNDRTWAYDPATGLATRYTQHLGGATVDTALAHDRAGRLVSAATAGGESQSYRYDAGGQLLAVTTNGAPSHAYDYDALGRRTGSTEPAGAFDYAYDAAGRLLARTTPDADYPLSVKAQINGQTVGTLAGHRPGDATYAYDPDGRRTARTGPEGTTTYSYGPDGRLATTAAGEVTTRRSYDAAGRLGAVAVDDATPDTTRVVWDDSPVPQPLELSDARGRVELVRGAGLIGVTTDAGPTLVSADHLGSALATPATASVVGAGSYGPFGEPVTPARAEPTAGYRGELQVGGLLHLRARDYDPKTGAFTTRDPLDGVDGTATVANAYHYADNDPLNRIDPTGMRTTDPNLNIGDFDDPCAFPQIAAALGVGVFQLGGGECILRSPNGSSSAYAPSPLLAPPGVLIRGPGGTLGIALALAGLAYYLLPGSEVGPVTPLAPETTPTGTTTTTRKQRPGMLFQVQIDLNTKPGFYERAEAANENTGVTVAEAHAALERLFDAVSPRRLREASGPSFVIVRNWVAQRPPHGVSESGDVKRQEFYHGKEKWRIDVVNVHGRNLRV